MLYLSLRLYISFQRFLSLLRAAMTAEHGSAVVNAMAYELWYVKSFKHHGLS
jgi:hypothetical protein